MINPNNDSNKNEAPPTQPAPHNEHPINPFRDAEPAADAAPSTEEEIALEQQRKEALTERD